MIDISKDNLQIVLSILKNFVPNSEIRVFGSRYNGTSKKYSDLDIAIVSDKELGWELISDIKESFQDSDITFRVDVLDWNNTEDYFKKIIIDKGYESLFV